MKETRVLIADDEVLLRDLLVRALNKENGIEVVGEADTGRVAVELSRKLSPDVVLMDIAMPGLNGIEATRHIVQSQPGTHVVIMSMHTDDVCVKDAAAVGAVGYYDKNDTFPNLVKAIEQVMRGESYFSPTVSRRLLDVLSSYRKGLSVFSAAANLPDPVLSPREKEVLQLVVEEKTNVQIAKMLGISVKTVEKHRQSVMDTLDIHTVAGLTKHAVAQGIVFLKTPPKFGNGAPIRTTRSKPKESVRS